jgi:nucleoside phosphorylase
MNLTMGKIMEEEDIIESCKSIIHFLVKEKDEGVRQLKYKDFLYKINQRKTPPGFVLKKKGKVDVIIFTVIDKEYEALKCLFQINDNTKIEDKDFNGIEVWKINNIKCVHGDDLRALIVFIGAVGELECSIAAMRVFQKYDCELAVLCGIAAGIHNERKKYSVIMSEGIVDYEPQRLEPNGKIIYRPNHYNIKNNMLLLRNINTLARESNGWREYYKETVSQYGNIRNGEFDIKQVEESELKIGIIASGRKLIANDDILGTLRDAIPVGKGIVAAEMESAGFCIACDEFSINWLVIRGISDHGGEDKNDPSNKKYQHIAAFGAFTALLYYLKHIFKRVDEDSDSTEEF